MDMYNYKLPVPRDPHQTVTLCISAQTAHAVGNAIWDIIREVARKSPADKLTEIARFVSGKGPFASPDMAQLNILLTEMEHNSRFHRYPVEYLPELQRAFEMFENLLLSLNQE